MGKALACVVQQRLCKEGGALPGILGVGVMAQSSGH